MPQVPHCPHCLLPLPGAVSLPHPPVATRCPTCRLVIGAGRARPAATGEDGEARSRGSAAGVLANAARRSEAEVGSVPEVLGGLCRAAGVVGCQVERLRMLDYQQEADLDPDLPSLGTVLATFPTWKAARAAAATSGQEPPADTGEAARVA